METLYGVQMHLLMDVTRCTLIVDAWRYNGDLCIWGVAALACGCMETPGYGVKMQWMHGDPWVRGEDAVDAWRPLGTG